MRIVYTVRMDKVQRNREYYERNRDRILRRTKEYRQRDPWKTLMMVKAASANRRYPGKLTWRDMATVFERQGRICFYCGKTDLHGRDLTIEHIKPINDPQFLTVSCLACNIARIQTRGPRKSAEQKRKEACARTKQWIIDNRERYNARWWKMGAEARQRRRDYIREYMRRRRAQKKEG